MRPSVRVVRLAIEYGPNHDGQVVRRVMADAWHSVSHRFLTDLQQHEVDALTSLLLDIRYFQAGLETTWGLIVRAVNAENRLAAAGLFSEFCKNRGLTSSVMARKRMAEQQLFLKGDYVRTVQAPGPG